MIRPFETDSYIDSTAPATGKNRLPLGSVEGMFFFAFRGWKHLMLEFWTC